MEAGPGARNSADVLRSDARGHHARERLPTPPQHCTIWRMGDKGVTRATSALRAGGRALKKTVAWLVDRIGFLS